VRVFGELAFRKYIYILMVYGNVRKIIVKYILIEKQKVVLFYNLGKIKDKLLLVL
jgi:hypothetical protein